MGINKPELYAALGDKQRIEILLTLYDSKYGKSVDALKKIVPSESLKYNLKILEISGLVEKSERARKRQFHYTLTDTGLKILRNKRKELEQLRLAYRYCPDLARIENDDINLHTSE